LFIAFMQAVHLLSISCPKRCSSS